MKKLLVIVIISIAISISVTSISAQSQMDIPKWVKNNALWWGQGQISDSDYLAGLEYLVNNNYINVGIQSGDTEQLEEKIESLSNLKEGYQKSAIELKKENERLESLIEQYKQSNKELRDNYDEVYEWYLEEFNRNQEWQQAWDKAETQYAELYEAYQYYYNLSTGSNPSNYQSQQSTPSSSSQKSSQSSNSICSGNARCLTGTVTKITDGDTIKIDGQSIRFALASAPELDETDGQSAKEFINNICPVGSVATVDEDDEQTQGSYGRILGVIYCNGLNLNEELLDSGLGYLSTRFCNTSEFSNDSWARKHGC